MHRAGRDDPPIHVHDVPEQEWHVGELQARRRRLGAFVGAHKIGVAITTIAPGARSTPPHSHADEEEIFYVLAGDGLSYQTSGSHDVHTYRVSAGDILVHLSGGPAHTLIAGEQGMQVLILAEGSRTRITYLPRTKQFWLGSRWSPADSPPPFKADADAGPLELPEPTDKRPPTIVALSDIEIDEGGQGRFAWATRGADAAGAQRLVLGHDAMPPGSINTPRHWHTMAEECFYVQAGSGIARIGDAEHPLRPGSFFLRPPATGVAHRIEVGEEGMDLITMGDRVPGDVCVYPDSGKVAVRPGVWLPIADLQYFDGEPDAEVPL